MLQQNHNETSINKSSNNKKDSRFLLVINQALQVITHVIKNVQKQITIHTDQ